MPKLLQSGFAVGLCLVVACRPSMQESSQVSKSAIQAKTTNESTEPTAGESTSARSRADDREELRKRLAKDLSQVDEAELSESVEMFIRYVSDAEVNDNTVGPDADDVQLASSLCRQLEHLNPDQATQVCEAVTSAFGQVETIPAEVPDAVARLAGLKHRLSLVGKPFSISGTTIDGEPVAWSDYAGRTVLIEFWATWCGPCMDEMQNTLDCYDRFHDRGFDVIGVSTDVDTGRLRQFLTSADLPWSTIHSPTSEENNLSNQFGVLAIPCNILVGADGKVRSVSARGEELEKLLEEFEQ